MEPTDPAAAPPAHPYTEAELEAAIDMLTQEGRFAEAEAIVARSAPGLQRVLDSALLAGGYFGSTHDSETLKAATTPDPDERIVAIRTLLAEEARMGMMVGVAVGWALQAELSGPDRVVDPESGKPGDKDQGRDQKQDQDQDQDQGAS